MIRIASKSMLRGIAGGLMEEGHLAKSWSEFSRINGFVFTISSSSKHVNLQSNGMMSCCRFNR